jgi:hypothetical protein
MPVITPATYYVEQFCRDRETVSMSSIAEKKILRLVQLL